MLELNVMYKRPIIFTLCFSLLAVPVLQAGAKSTSAVVRIALISTRITDVDGGVRGDILRRLERLFTGLPHVQLVPLDALPGADGVNPVDSTAVFAFGQRHHLDFIYAAELTNRGRDGTRVLLVGELRRYDLNAAFVHRYEILSFYDKLGRSLQQFREQFVLTIVPKEEKGKNILPVLVLGGVAVAGILAMTLAFTSANATGGGSDNRGAKTP